MSFQENAFHAEMDALALSLPRSADFEYDLFDGDLRIVGLYLPETRTGIGRRFREQLLALTDRHGLSTSMQADETGDPRHPSTFELVRYYVRFGYVIDHCDRDAFLVTMHRAARPVRDDIASISSDYETGKACDLTLESFEALKGTILKEGWDTADSAPYAGP